MEKLIKELKEILEEELKIYKEMLQITEKKTKVITSGTAKELDKTTQIEQTMILKIAKLENQREKIVENIKIQVGINGEASVAKLTEKISAQYKNEVKELESIRDELLDILNKIKKRNELNSKLINDSLEYINFNINLLTSSATETTYTNKVEEGNAGKSQSLFDAKV
ncbi:flagellar protein FlgN [Caldisalinibacter kiritimatiensis]|uniref:FlgN protein n=1 Tax=Caldisalinibacter kiritimatiensis TaxID=1304284 RepID=R1CL07_9FIRM|nr:flagellar protein FlgN [Caldisalinibacter kiritimatiensis]EOC99395.1 hypothetical protein L21TH_2576 [Caldisalinibacter kiritimatiensis]